MSLLGPRFAIFVWWLADSARWQSAFDSFAVGLLGFFFLPWTTLAYVLVAPSGNIVGFDWFVLALAFVVDLGTYGGGAKDRLGR